MDYDSNQGGNCTSIYYTTFQFENQVPDYVGKVTPYFFCLVALELLILYSKTSSLRLNDTLTSCSLWILHTTFSTVIRGVGLIGYHWVYQWRLLNLDWDSAVTWWTAAIAVDFIYYWFHRFVHETAVGWSIHQVHHSSEDYTLTVSIRQHSLQKCFTLGFYLPCALIGIPVPALLVHLQLNELYQFWIHTELVSTLGPLEWILNTPSHHRVHHGSDPWCLDKNYGALLIIWDRMFGTFASERKDVKITYGIVTQPNVINVIYLQTFYLQYIFSKAWQSPDWMSFLKVLLYPPAWVVGKQWSYKEPFEYEVAPHREKYDPKLPKLLSVYVIGHFVMSLLIQQEFIRNYHSSSWLSVVAHIVFLLITLGNIGAIYDDWHGAMALETLRCFGIFLLSQKYSLSQYPLLHCIFSYYCGISAIWWLVTTSKAIHLTGKTYNKIE